MFRGVIRIFEHTFALLRIFMLISITCFMPRLFVTTHKEIIPLVLPTVDGGSFSLGIENVQKRDISYVCASKQQMRIGLVTQPHTTDQKGTSNIDVLKNEGLSVTKAFYPRNSLWPHKQMGAPFNSDAVVSFAVGNQGFTQEMLHEVDLLMVDLPDIGLGYIRALTLLFEAIHAATIYDIPIIVLDRPNIMGAKIEGSLCYVAQLPIKIPLRYGMTMAELAQYYNAQILNGNARLHVVPMQGYHRIFSSTMQGCFVSQVKSVAELYGYSMCGILAEVAPFDVGLDTEYCYSCLTLPQSIDLPERRWYQLQIMLRHMGIKSTLCRHYSSKKKEICRGLRLQVNDVEQIDCFKVVILMLEFFKRSGVILAFSDSFDLAVGTPLVRQYLQGKVTKKILCETINEELESFYRKAFGAFMYHPLPQVCLL